MPGTPGGKEYEILSLKNHPLVKSLLGLKGNPKACVLAEPLWGIPYQLYMPFVSLYMAALGLTDVHIGIVTSISMLFRALSAALSGAITDKLGRRRATVIFDCISWSLPCLLWAVSQNFWWFVVAAMCNGLWQITENSWTCLLVEDAEKDQMVNIYSWIHVSGQLAVFFAPLSSLLVRSMNIVPAMRILYLFSFVSMTAKFLLLYRYCTETGQGKVRMEESKGQTIFSLLAGYWELIPNFFRSQAMRTAMTITILFNITTMVSQNYFGLYATENHGMPSQYLAYFPIVRAVIILLFLFWIQPILNRMTLNRPMLGGILLYIASHLVLIFAPKGKLFFLVAYVVLEACAHAMFMPRKDSITALYIDPKERARMVSIMTVVMLGITMPFGYIAGQLSALDRRLAFCLNLLLFLAGFCVVAASRLLRNQKMAEE